MLPKLARPHIKIIENFVADLECDWLKKLRRERGEQPSFPL
jgi:hypothetical protein